MKIEFKMKVDLREPLIIFLIPRNFGYWLGRGEFDYKNSSYPPRLYKIHDWHLRNF